VLGLTTDLGTGVGVVFGFDLGTGAGLDLTLAFFATSVLIIVVGVFGTIGLGVSAFGCSNFCSHSAENAFVERFSKQTGLQELTRNIVDELILEVKIYSADKIEIVFNFVDEYEKIVPLLNTSKSERKRKR